MKGSSGFDKSTLSQGEKSSDLEVRDITFSNHLSLTFSINHDLSLFLLLHRRTFASSLLSR